MEESEPRGQVCGSAAQGAPRRDCWQRGHDAYRALGAVRRQKRGHLCGLRLEPGDTRGRQSGLRAHGGGKRNRGCASQSQVTPTPGPSILPGGVFSGTSLFLRLQPPLREYQPFTLTPRALQSVAPAVIPTECTDYSKPREVEPPALGHSAGPAGARTPGKSCPPTSLELTLENIPESVPWMRTQRSTKQPLDTAGAMG